MNILPKIKILILTILIFCNVGMSFGLTENSKVSVLTYEAGNELYTIFGHTALRIQDSALHIDNVYNFGTFDFSSPFFYIRFFGGKLDYFLTIIDYKSFVQHSILEQRTIYEQTIDLTHTERDYMFYRLNEIYNSKERFYKYDFFYDNCATRIRDLIEEVNRGKIHYDSSNYCCKTFRELLNPYISKNYWIDFGINIALGREADKIAKSSDFMFLPDFIFRILDDSQQILKTETIIDLSNKQDKINIFSIPLLIAIIVVILLLLGANKTRNLTFYAYNSLFVLIGVFILLLSLLSDNSAFRENYNVFWTLPALFVLLTKKRVRRVIEIVFIVGLLVILIFGRQLYPGFSWTFIPWILIMILMYLTDLQVVIRLKTFANNKYRSLGG